jgi:hypothetical protein
MEGLKQEILTDLKDILFLTLTGLLTLVALTIALNYQVFLGFKALALWQESDHSCFGASLPRQLTSTFFKALRHHVGGLSIPS